MKSLIRFRSSLSVQRFYLRPLLMSICTNDRVVSQGGRISASLHGVGNLLDPAIDGIWSLHDYNLGVCKARGSQNLYTWWELQDRGFMKWPKASDGASQSKLDEFN